MMLFKLFSLSLICSLLSSIGFAGTLTRCRTNEIDFKTNFVAVSSQGCLSFQTVKATGNIKGFVFRFYDDNRPLDKGGPGEYAFDMSYAIWRSPVYMNRPPNSNVNTFFNDVILMEPVGAFTPEKGGVISFRRPRERKILFSVLVKKVNGNWIASENKPSGCPITQIQVSFSGIRPVFKCTRPSR